MKRGPSLVPTSRVPVRLPAWVKWLRSNRYAVCEACALVALGWSLVWVFR